MTTHTTADEPNNPRLVDSLNHPLAIELQNLLSEKNPEALPAIIIEDEENILQALAAKVNIRHLFTTDKTLLSNTLKKALLPSIALSEISKRTCKKLFTHTRASDLFAVADYPEKMDLNKINDFKGDIVVLDRLAITGNAGAIIRTSAAFNADMIVFLETDYHHIYDRRIIRSSRGYLFSVPLVATDTATFINFCYRNKIAIVTTAANARQTIQEAVQHPGPIAIVLGAEKTGCSDLLSEKAQIHARIPMNSKVESLNVSVAASIALYLRNMEKTGFPLARE